METFVVLLVLGASLVGMPVAIRAMKRWLRGSRSGGIVGSVGAGLAAAHDPTAALILAETEKREAAKGDEDKEGADE